MSLWVKGVPPVRNTAVPRSFKHPAIPRPHQTTARVLRVVDENRTELLEELARLVRIPSLYGNEEACQEAVVERMGELGLKVDHFVADVRRLRAHPDYTPVRTEAIGSKSRPNVCGLWEGSGGGRSLAMAAHIDHLQVGNRALWSNDPFAAAISRGRMVGRGVANDKGGVAMMLSAVGILESAGVRLKGDLIAMSSLGGRDYGEGDSCGLFACALRGYKADAGIYLHPHEEQAGLSKIVVSSMGAVTFSIKVKGTRPAVFYEDWKGVNAIMKAARVLDGLGQACAAEGLKLNAGLIKGGGRWQQGGIGEGGPILTPEECTIECRITFDHEHRLGEVRGWIPKMLGRLASGDPWLRTKPPEIEFKHFQCESSAVDTSHPIVRAASDAIALITHVRPTIEHSESPSDIRFLTMYADTPTIKYGPLGGGGDRPNEWIDVKEYIDSVKVTCLLIMNWCGLSE
jgi:acetylornithine deacetylase